MTPNPIIDSPEDISSFCLEQLDIWISSPQSVFSWPMDRIAGKPYEYIIHISIVEAWNNENRETNCEKFHRQWLSDLSNIERVISRWNNGEVEI